MLGNQFIVGRHDEVQLFRDLMEGRTNYQLLNIYGPGGIGKSVVFRQMAASATSHRIPVGCVDARRSESERVADGADSKLTADHVLLAWKDTLIQSSTRVRLERSFREFDAVLRDYLAAQKVLERGGGIAALFDPVGKLSIPIVSLLGNMATAISKEMRNTIENRAALDRYLRGADRALTAAFVSGLQAALKEVGEPLALLVDTYEDLEDLDGWMCRTVAPALPQGVRLVILGRNELRRINFDWIESGIEVESRPLSELPEENALEYLRHFGVSDPALLQRVYAYTSGYPLLLVLARDLAYHVGGWDNIGSLELERDRDEMARKLLMRILREERVQAVRAFLEKGCVAVWFDPAVIALVLDVGMDQAAEIYDKIERHSFVERHPRGLQFHDKIRELLTEHFKYTDEAEFERVRDKLKAYYMEKAGIAATDEPKG